MREDIFSGAWALAAMAVGALASFLAIRAIDDAHLARTCRFESVRVALPEAERPNENYLVRAEPLWTHGVCTAVIDNDELPQVFSERKEFWKAAVDRAREIGGREVQYFKVLIAAAAMFWLYTFNPDVQRRVRRRPAPRAIAGQGSSANFAATSPQGSEADGNKPASDLSANAATGAGGVAPAPPAESRSERPYTLMSRNYPALFCYGFAASACIYFTASTAGTAAANYFAGPVYGDNIYTWGGKRETIIRELHFPQFLDREDDPRAYDSLAWHFFFEEGDLKQGSSCMADAAEFEDVSFKFRDDLETSLVGNRLGQIVEALASCATEGRPVRLVATGQSSLRKFALCTEQSEKLNRELAGKRAEKLRDMFKEALAKADAGVRSKVVIDEKTVEYPFNFSDAKYDEIEGTKVALGRELPSSPYYLAQSAALVLEDPSQCDKPLEVAGTPASPAE